MRKMKKFIYCALIALITISCEQIEDPWENSIDIPKTLSAYTPEFESQGSGSKSRVLSEDLPESWDDTEMPHTRTYAVINPAEANEYIQYWSEGDAISVFFTTANLKYTLAGYKDENGDGTDDEDYGLFETSSTATSGTPLADDVDYYAVYPYKTSTAINYENGEITYNFPKTQHYSEDSYANEENGMIAHEPKAEYDGRLYFQNFCSYLQLRMIADNSNANKKVKQITLVANNTSDKMAGDAAINVVNGAPVVSMKVTAGNQIVLDCGAGVTLSQDSSSPTKFWFVLPGSFTFTNGFTITVTFDDNTYFEKSTDKKITIERSHIKPMATFTADSNDDIILTGPIRYKYNSTNSNEPYALTDEFYGENGEKLQIINQVYDAETGEWVVYLSGKLKKIGGNCFQEKKPNIEYIKIEEETDEPIIIGDFAFYNCTADYLIINNDVESIGKSALKGSTVKELTINGDVSVIAEDAFTGSTRLQSFEANSVETIQKGAFQMCTNLTTLSIPGLKHLGISAFEDCGSLQSVTLDAIITIDDAAFMGCYSLEYVEISSACTMIGEGAFCNAESLETVICHAAIPPFIKTDNPDGSFVFDCTADNLCIYIPSGSMSAYTDSNYFVKNPSGYTSPIQTTVNWWYQEYTGKLQVMQ